MTAILSDIKNWESEGISSPDIIVVSGDVVQGVLPDNQDFESELTRQYEEATDFLNRLTTEIVGGIKSRVIVVPGNHDVNWAMARRAMTQMTECPEDVYERALEPDSKIRWNWVEQQAYCISDKEAYASRYDHFRNFQSNFYSDAQPTSLTICENDIVFADYPDLGVAVAGLASWYGNDCFCHVGNVDPQALETARRKLEESQAQIAIAAWHHSISGGPTQVDYMDAGVVENLIHFGYSIGLHGHQHYSSAGHTTVNLPNAVSMTVVSAGSLAVGDLQLPASEPRQFNLIEIEPENDLIRIHVRAMSKSGYFTGCHRNDFGGNSFVELELQPSPFRPNRPSSSQLLDDAIKASDNGQYKLAIEIINHIDETYSIQKRQVTIKALEGLGDIEGLTEYLNPPINADETIKRIDLLIKQQRFDEAEEQLENASQFLDLSLFDDLARMIDARRMMS